MTAGQVIALLRRVHGTESLLLDPVALALLREVLEQHEADVRECCALIAEEAMGDSLEAALIAAAIRGECT